MGDEDIQHTSESALLTAGWRAMESSRPNALFHDPLAAGLAGERGLRIARICRMGRDDQPFPIHGPVHFGP